LTVRPVLHLSPQGVSKCQAGRIWRRDGDIVRLNPQDGATDADIVRMPAAEVTGLLTAGEATIIGKLTVGGLIDPTGLQCQQQAVAPVGAVAATGTFWVQTHTPTNPMFTDSSGASTLLLPVMSDYVSVLQYGAVGNGVTDCTAAFVAAAAVADKNVYIPRGVYVVGTVTFARNVRFSPGASMLLLSPTSVWTFNGGLEAEIMVIFQNLPAWTPPAQAPIVVNQAVNSEGWVDWFGIDAPSIEACHKVFTVTMFQNQQYFLTRTLVLDQSYKQVVGVYGDAEGNGGTRLLMIGAATATQTVVQVGKNTAAQPTDCTRRLEIRGINTYRSGACNLSTSRYTAPIGWLFKNVYQCYFYQIFDYGSATSFRMRECLQSTFERLNCVNVTPAVGGAGGDNYTAYLIGGDAPFPIFIGSNASLLIKDCACDGGTPTVTGDHQGQRQIGSTGVWTDTTGVYLFGYIADTWINQLDLSKLTNGFVIDGNNSSGVQVTAPLSQQDVIIDRVVVDTMQKNAMLIQNLNAGSMLQITDPYLSTNTIAAQLPSQALQVLLCTGMVNVNGGILMYSADTAAVNNYGISIQNSRNVTVQGAILKDFAFGMFCANSSAIRATSVIMTRPTATATGAGLYLDGVSRSYFAPVINGVNGAWTYGFQMPGNVATAFNEIELTGIQIASLVGGLAVSKLIYGTPPVAWNGVTTTFGAAANNIITGVLN